MARRVLEVPDVTEFPPLPEKSLYQHLSHRERMVGGFPYTPFDAELTRMRRQARVLQRKFNDTDEDDVEGRREILRQLLNPDCRQNKIYIEPDFRCDYGVNISIGDNFQSNFNCVFLDCARITVGDNCLFGPNVQLYAGTHHVDSLTRQANDDYIETAYPIKIGDNCWLGGMTVVLPGVTIGNNVVVGTGSVVTKDVPDDCVVAGNPARVIRKMPPRTTVTPKKNPS
ncbi:unnamed protein product [Orchesella dallaii]|uniref:Maltose/galactoside acetyltransferase domain-containing protein n=1 Tax=Orchesella dallaii TaxID=48710 RepID=A0ABP1R9H0_9HEXA